MFLHISVKTFQVGTQLGRKQRRGDSFALVTALAFIDEDLDGQEFGGDLTWQAPASIDQITHYAPLQNFQRLKSLVSTIKCILIHVIPRSMQGLSAHVACVSGYLLGRRSHRHKSLKTWVGRAFRHKSAIVSRGQPERELKAGNDWTEFLT